MFHAHDGMGWWMVWGGVMFVLFWGAIIFLVVWALQAVARRGTGDEARPESGRARAPLDIAKERYARGEINREQFEQIKRDLEGT